ncbi:unnamed protein product [Durusdinium trenchii]|uniref:Uncharacterized protein n=2 Tax=Durusdinium trenchii TaxID=1381693 RepID=A0ABP0MVF2_9DINO
MRLRQRVREKETEKRNKENERGREKERKRQKEESAKRDRHNQGKLEDAGNRLVFSDGDVWTRQLPIHVSQAEKSLEAAPCSGSSPPADLPKDASIVDGDIDIETLEWKLQNEEEMLLSEEKIVTAVAEVLFKAVAQHDTERVREGLKQAALLGEEAVKSLLSRRDEQGDTMLHLAFAGSRQCADRSAASYAEIVSVLLSARADVNAHNHHGATVRQLAESTPSQKEARKAQDVKCLSFADPGSAEGLHKEVMGTKETAQSKEHQRITEKATSVPVCLKSDNHGLPVISAGSDGTSTHLTQSSSLASLTSPDKRHDGKSGEDFIHQSFLG